MIVYLFLFWELVMYQYLSANKAEYIDYKKMFLRNVFRYKAQEKVRK